MMAQKTLSICAMTAFMVHIAFSAPVSAEFICSSEVSYKWIKGKTSAATAREGQQPPPTVGAEGGQLSIVRFSAIERSGADEAAARQALQQEVNRQKIRASESCRREHEAYGACVSTKLSVQSSTLNSLSFSARTEVEKAIIDECKEQQGSCTAIEATEPQCKEVIPPTPAGGSEPKKADGKKAEGKKK